MKLRRGWLGLSGLMLLLLLMACSDLTLVPTPGAPVIGRDLVVATPTPLAVALQVEHAWVYPEPALQLPAPGLPDAPAVTLPNPLSLGATPLGVFVIVEARITNTGGAPLALQMAEFYTVDPAGRTFPRAWDAEFALSLQGYALVPERALPPGVSVVATLVLDVPADFANPLQLGLRFPGTVSELWSAPFEVEVVNAHE